ncbi:MAG TPA: hypothetical protein VMF55_09085 [Solirubrobacterales bacterium]|nr:hypothetical protein [Solirubrobacterales bacterium]
MKRSRKLSLGALLTVCALFGVVSSASAHSGEFARFNYCPSTTAGVAKCLVSETAGGKVVLGKKTVPIVNTVTLQGGVSTPVAHFSTFFGATNGNTLSKTPQPVPGGLTGLVNCKEISLSWLRVSCEAVFENGLTGVNATVELARPASEIKVSEVNLITEEGVAVVLPVKVHLENPLLGSSCYIGSSSSPINWNLTTGETTPPAGTAPIKGEYETFELREHSEIAVVGGVRMVDNAWGAPEASGCGGWPAEYILDPIINASVGVPSAAGKNVAALEQGTIYLATVASVNGH